MKRFNLYESSADLKLNLRIPNFLGEATFRKNANIAPGSIIPVIVPSSDNGIYLHSMRWGIHLFENSNQTLHTARAEGITNTPSWSSLSHQRAVIVCKGFYLWNGTRVYDAIKRITYRDNQPYFVSPEHNSEGDFFYIAAIYKITQKHRSLSYSVSAISTNTQYDAQFSAYCERMPFFIRRRDVKRWLNPETDIARFLREPMRINTNKFMKIGLWVNCPEDHTEESVVLQSREEWEKEQNKLQMESILKDIENDKDNWLDDGDEEYGDLDFDLIEKEAMKQNDAQKSGLDYKTNWNELKLNKQNKNALHIELGLPLEEEEKEDSEYCEDGVSKKRKFREDNTDFETEEDVNEPPNKKRKMNDI
eukprot:246877_1